MDEKSKLPHDEKVLIEAFKILHKNGTNHVKDISDNRKFDTPRLWSTAIWMVARDKNTAPEVPVPSIVDDDETEPKTASSKTIGFRRSKKKTSS